MSRKGCIKFSFFCYVLVTLFFYTVVIPFAETSYLCVLSSLIGNQ